MATSAAPGERCLTGTAWSVRLGRGLQGRPALEVYEAETLIDVVVATPVAPEILRGARRGAWGGHPSAIAWGRLPADSSLPVAVFSRGWRDRGRGNAEVIEVGGFCWLAVAHGRFTRVTVTHRGARRGRLRIGRR